MAPKSLEIVQDSHQEFTVKLATEPDGGPVTVEIAGGTDDVNPSPTELTFTQANWGSPKTVRVQVSSPTTSSTDDPVPVTLNINVTAGNFMYDPDANANALSRIRYR